MKSSAFVKAMAVLGVLVITVALCPTNLYSQCNYPNYGTGISIDGSDSDWGNPPTDDLFSEMYRAGNTSGDVLSNIYLRYDCQTETMYALVLAQTWPEDPILAEDGEEVYIRLGSNNKLVSADDQPNAFRYIEEGTRVVSREGLPDTTLAIARGWEAMFNIEPGEYTDLVIAHNNVWDQSQYNDEGFEAGSQTSKTPELLLCIECDPIGVDLQNFNAIIVNHGVLIEWGVASEINHAGYNIYRATSIDGDYVKINAGLIGGDPTASSLEEKHYEYLDKDATGTLYYKLEDISLDGQSEWHGPTKATVTSNVADDIKKPYSFELVGNYPNPFNPTTTIAFTLPMRSDMNLNIYDVHGKLIQTLVNSIQSAGEHTVVWDGTNSSGEFVSSGIYLYRMTAGDFSQTGRMTLLK